MLKLENSRRRKRQIRQERDAPIAIVGRTPDGDNHSIKHHFIAFHGQLMRSGNQIYGVVVNELSRDVRAKEVSGTPRRYTPSFDI